MFFDQFRLAIVDYAELALCLQWLTEKKPYIYCFRTNSITPCSRGALHLDGLGLALLGDEAATLARSIRLGFLGSWRFRCEDARL